MKPNNLHNRRANKIGLLLFFCFMSIKAHAYASIADAHNIAEICTSVQTALKDYSLVGMGVKYGDPAAHLRETIEKIDHDFSQLKENGHLGPKLNLLVTENLQHWQAIRATLTQPPKADMVLSLHHSIEKMDKKCWEIAELIAEETHIEGEHYVIVAFELGMEVQRLAALYMMRAWEVKNDSHFEEVEMVFQEFEEFYQELKEKAYPKYLSDKAKLDLEKIEKDFSAFKYMAASKSGRFVPSLGQRTARKLNDSINELIKDVITNVEGR